jgi:hypothetical protein
VPVTVHHPTRRKVHDAFRDAFAWRRAFALGVLVPAPNHGAWAARHPMAFAALSALEAIVRGWPVLRGLGDHLVLEGVRR